MATTDVHIGIKGDALVPDVPAVNVVAGDSIAFFADRESGARLCMTRATAAFLTPPTDGAVTIAAGDSATFQFSAASPGVYSIVVQWPKLPCPVVTDKPGGNSASLSIRSASGTIYSGPADGGPQT